MQCAETHPLLPDILCHLAVDHPGIHLPDGSDPGVEGWTEGDDEGSEE